MKRRDRRTLASPSSRHQLLHSGSGGCDKPVSNLRFFWHIGECSILSLYWSIRATLALVVLCVDYLPSRSLQEFQKEKTLMNSYKVEGSPSPGKQEMKRCGSLNLKAARSNPQ